MARLITRILGLAIDLVGFVLFAGGIVCACLTIFLAVMSFSKNEFIAKQRREFSKGVWIGVALSLLCFLCWHLWESSEFLQTLADFGRLPAQVPRR